MRRSAAGSWGGRGERPTWLAFEDLNVRHVQAQLLLQRVPCFNVSDGQAALHKRAGERREGGEEACGVRRERAWASAAVAAC